MAGIFAPLFCLAVAQAATVADLPGTRREEAGWVYLKLAGSPRHIGKEYGRLAKVEIQDAHAALKLSLKENTGKDWSWFRDTSKAIYWDKIDKEYQEELAGQAEGLTQAGFKADTWDVLAFNSYIETEGYYIPSLQNKPSNKEACSAFVSTGSATKDGKVVMGHNLWWDYRMGQRFNFILDVTPAKGNRFVMDALAGFIHSGSDFAINSAGILITETTISGFAGFDTKGIPEFMRMRKATQYANSLDEFAAIMKKGNNGGYANTWLLADTKTNEIGKLELGLKNVIFATATDGSFVGSNFPENPKLIAEEIPGGWDSGDLANGCERRRARWKTLLRENDGQVTDEKAKAFLADTYDEVLKKNVASGGVLCGKGPLSGAINSKVVTADLAGKMSFWARMGVSDGSERKFGANRPAMLRDIPSQPWVFFRPEK